MTSRKVMKVYYLVDTKCDMHFCGKSEEHPYGFYSTFTRRVYQAVPDKHEKVRTVDALHKCEILELDLSSGIIPLGMHDLSDVKGVVATVVCENDPSELIPAVQERLDAYFRAIDARK